MCASRAHNATQQDTAADAVTAAVTAAATSASASADQDPAHRCGICGKAFERRDLRDRHKRRCAQTFTKPKRSKRRSCHACAVSKLGCDQEQPSCRRCLTRNISCEYVGDTGDAESAGPHKTPGRVEDGSTVDTVSQILASLGDNTSLIEIDRLPGGDSAVSDGMTTPNEAISATDGHFMGTVSPSIEMPRSSRSYSIAVSARSHHVTPSWSPSMEHAAHEAFPFSTHTPTAGSGIARLPYDTFGVSGGGDDEMNWSGSQLDRNEMAFASLWNNIGAHSKPPHALGSPTAASSVRTAGSAAHNGESSALGGMRHQGGHAARSPAAIRDVVLSPEDMVNIILSYLPMMVSRDPPAPPFVHDQVYRCGDGDVKEPIARAMVCINAHTGAMPSGRKFVHEMISTERGRLIKSFHQCTSETDMLAVLHAMIVYQALGLFSDSAEQIRDGALHQPFLLKMVRKVAQKYHKDLIHDPTSPAPSGWRQWCFIETLRRTVFLAHAINVLSTCLQKQDPFFYEALDADLVMDMPLPAPAALWDATTEAGWSSARATVPWIPRTGRMVQREKTGAARDYDIFTRTILATLPYRALVCTREGRREDQALLGHFLTLKPFLTTQNYHQNVRLNQTINLSYMARPR